MANKLFLEKAYLAYFGRPVDATGAVDFANSTEAEVAAAFSASAESKALFGPTFGASQINLIYQTLFGRVAETEGIAYWLHQVELGLLTPTGAAMGILGGARNADITSAANKLAASSAFTTSLDTPSEKQGYAGNDAAAAARDFLKTVTTTTITQTQVNIAVQEAVAIGNNTVGQLFTLTESLSAAKVGTPAVMGPVMWGYNPHPHTEGTTAVDNTGAGTVDHSGVISNPSNNVANLSNEGPSDGGIPVADLISFLTTITGLDVKKLGLIDASGQQTFANVTSLTISNAVAGGSANNASAGTPGAGSATANPMLTVGYADGSSMNAEVALGAGYMKFLNDLLFDAQGNSRLYQNVVTPATSGSNAALQAIKLTPSLNNGGTLEASITTTKGDDTIVAGRLELLQGAYIDGGKGYNTLEIDAKGTYAQPAELLNIQEIRVNDLPNWYTTTSTINGAYVSPTNTNSSTDLNGTLNNGYLNNSSYPQLSTVPHTNDSWLDLSRATALKKLVITDGGTVAGGSVSGSNQTSGNLTIVGIRNAGVEGNVTRLEGSFPDTLNLQYGQGQTGTLSLELALGDVTGSINLLQNAAVLNIDSQGVVNHMHNFFAGGSISRMYVKGAGEFAIDQNIAPSFNQNTAVVIDATANTGGLNINFDASGADVNQGANAAERFASVTVKGTTVNDEITVKNVKAYTGDQTASNNGATTLVNGKVTIDAGAGDNVVVTDGSSIVKVTTGAGDDTIFSKFGEVVTILAGDGSNVINTDSSKIVTITSGAGVDNISSLNGDAVTIAAGDGNNVITTDFSKVVSITTGTGNDSISSTGSASVVIDAGAGNNTIKASGTSAVNITTGAGNDKITAVGNDITIMSGGGNDVITVSGTDASFGVTAADGALLNINTGATGSATINFGNDQTTVGFGFQLKGVTALDGSVIVGNNVKLYIDSPTNLTQADLTGLTGVTKVVLEGDRDNAASASNPLGNDTLRITADQFKALGAGAFSEHLAGAGAQTGDVYIVLGVGKAFDLSSVTDIASLSANVKLHFELQEGSNLTLTATQLHNYLADNAVTSVTGTNGQTATSPNGTVTLNGVGNSFTVGADGDADRVFGTINDASVDNVVITRSAAGFNRPADVVTTDISTIDSTGTAPLVITTPIVTLSDVLKITGNQDIQFKGVVAAGSPTNPFTVDFSALTGKVSGLTLDHFQDVKAIKGNGLAGTRIDVIVNGDVGSVGVNKGLNTSGVETYMVTKVDANRDGAPDNAGTVTINLCDLTQDVKFIGLKGNAGSTLVLSDVPWGKVAPHIVLEGDGYANASEALKVDGSPDTSDVGSITAIYNTGGAYAVVDINNGGVKLGVTASGADRKFVAGTVTLTGATSATVNVAQGDATIAAIAGSTLASVKLVATKDVTVTASLPALLKTVDASGVAGAFKATLVDPVDHAIVVTGGAGLLDLTLNSFNPTSAAEAGSSITGGTGLAKLTLTGSSDLSKTTLTNVDKVVVGNGLAVTLTLAQVAAIAIADITTTGAAATLNLVGLDSTTFSVGSLATGMKIGTVSLAANPVVTLDPATNLTGVDTLYVPDGTTLNLTAAQFQQLKLHTITGSGLLGSQGIVNITGLKQSDINPLDLNGNGVFTDAGDHAGFSLTGINGVKVGAITLAESVTLKATDSLGTFKNVVMGDGLTLALGELYQANGLKIAGGANTVLQILDTNPLLNGITAVSGKIDASGLSVSTIKVLNVLVANQNVDFLLDHLPGSVVKEIYNDLGMVNMINQIVTIDAGSTVGGNLTLNPITSDTELRNFTLNMSGGTEISGSLNLSTTAKVVGGADQMRTHLDTLTINSTGSSANLLNGNTANTITANITPLGAPGLADGASAGGLTNNNLLNLVINASQALVVKGDIVFSSVVGDDTYTGNDNPAAIATLTVTGTAKVSLGTVNTKDIDVVGLKVVNNSTGALSLTLDAAKIDQAVGNNDALSFTGTGAVALTVVGGVNLSADVLTAVNKITIADSSTLTLGQTQLSALGVAQLATGVSPTGVLLNVVNLGAAAFDATAIPAGIKVASVTLAAGTTTLAATTNLTGVGKIIVPEGSTLNLTAEQFQQLQGKGIITGLDTNGVAGDGNKFTLNITDLKQADVEFSDAATGGTAGFSLHDVQSNATVSIALASTETSVTMGKYSAVGVLSLPSDLLVGTTLTNTAKFVLAAGQTLGLVSSTQANALVVAGGANSTVALKFAALDSGSSLSAAGFNVTTLKALATFVGGTNVEAKLANVPSSVTELYYADSLDLGFVSATNRIAVVDAGVTVPGFLMYNDLQATQEVRSLDLTLSGGSKIAGNVDLSTTAKPSGPTDPIQRYLDSVTIHSKGTDANTITGNLTAVAGTSPRIENNLLNITIDATQKLVLGDYNATTGAYNGTGGNIVFTSVTDAASATLNITGTAAVTVHGLDATDNTSGNALTPDINTLTINNSGTGLFTATGGTPAITGAIENLVLKGAGAMAFGTNMVGGVVNAEGLTSSTISSIDASGLSGALSLGIVNDVNSAAFAFKAGSGATSLTFTDPVLSSYGADGVAGGTGVNADTAGWSFDFSNAAVGSTLHLNAVYDTADKGSLNIKLGANTTLYIDQSMDLTKMGLSITQVKDIVLADGAVLTLTAAQANALHIVAGVDTGAVGITAKVNIIDLGTAAVDFSHIATNIAGTVTLLQSNTATHAADVTLAATTDLGDFTVVLQSLDLGETNLSGQTVRYTNVAQADNAVSVVGSGLGGLDNLALASDAGANSSNVVWLFTSMTGPVDTSKYDAHLGRLLFNTALVNSFGGTVENMFTTLPHTILRVDFATVTVLNNLLSSNGIDRTMEFSSFTSVGNLTYSDIGVAPVEHLHSLNLVLGGQVTVGNVLIDDIIPSSGYNPLGANQFQTLTVDSHLALTGRTAASTSLPGGNPNANYLASEAYVNNNDGTTTSGVETARPNNINTVGNIGVGAANGLDLLTVTLKTNGLSVVRNTSAGDGAKLNVGTITYGYVPTTATPTQTATLNVSGANDVNVTSVNTSDTDLTALTVNTTGFTGVLTAPGASPALQLGAKVETLTFTNSNAATGTITLGSQTNAGVAGAEVSHINAGGFGGTLNLGTLAQIDSTNDDSTPLTPANDGMLTAFQLVAGSGITTATLGQDNGLHSTLAANSNWDFNLSAGKLGTALTITPDAVFTGGNLAIELGANAALDILGGVDLTTLASLAITGGSIVVAAGDTLTLTVAQEQALTTDVIGAGTVKIVGDASNKTLGSHLKAVGVDISGVTLVASPAAGADSNGLVELTLGDANAGTAAAPVLAGHTVVGSGNADAIVMTGVKGSTITGGLGNDAITLAMASANNTVNVDAGTDNVVGLKSGDALVVSAGATALAAVGGAFESFKLSLDSVSGSNAQFAFDGVASSFSGFTPATLASFIAGNWNFPHWNASAAGGVLTFVSKVMENLPDTLLSGFTLIGINSTLTKIADGSQSFTATAATVNNGTAILNAGEFGGTVDMHLATGTKGYTLTGGTSNLLGGDVLISSSFADIINGGNSNQSTAAAADTLTGNGGADVFQFNVSTSTPVAFTDATTTQNVDQERVQISTGPGPGPGPDGTITVDYSVNGGATVHQAVAVLGTDSSIQVATKIVASFAGVGGFSATSGSTDTVSITGPSGSGLAVFGVSNGGTMVSGNVSNGTQVAQIDHVDIGTISGGTVTAGEKFTLTYTLAGGATTVSQTYTALNGDTVANVVNGLVAAFSGDTNVSVASHTVNGVAGLDVTDQNPSNGGFTATVSALGAFNGSGASNLGATDIATADVITDFLSGTDKIQLGVIAGSSADYASGAQVADYAAALAAAGSHMNGTVQYYMTSVAASGTAAAYGVLFFDANHDGAVDGVVKLVGVDSAHFAATDIIF